MPSTFSLRTTVLAAAILFSTAGVAIKSSSLSGLELAATRSSVASIVLFALLPSWRAFWKWRPLAVGVCYANTLVCFVVATKYTMAANAIFLQSTAPIYVLLLAPRLLGEPNRRSDYFITAALMLGMALFFVEVDAASATASDPAFGNTLAIASGVSMAFALMGLRWLARDAVPGGEDPSGAAALGGNVIAAAACLPFCLPLPALAPIDLAIVGYLGAFQIGFAYWLLTRGIRGLPAVEVSLLLLAEPVLNTLWTWAVHGETPGNWSLAGCAVILAATCTRVLAQRGGD